MDVEARTEEVHREGPGKDFDPEPPDMVPGEMQS